MLSARVSCAAWVVATTLGSLGSGVSAFADTATIINQGPKPAYVCVRYLTQKTDSSNAEDPRTSVYQMTQGWTKVDPKGGKATIEVGPTGEFYLHARDQAGFVIPFGTESIQELVHDEPFDATRLLRESDKKGIREVSDRVDYVSGGQLSERRVPEQEDPAKFGWHLVTMYKLKSSSPIALMGATPPPPGTPTLSAKPDETPAARPNTTPVNTTLSAKPDETPAARPNATPVNRVSANSNTTPTTRASNSSTTTPINRASNSSNTGVKTKNASTTTATTPTTPKPATTSASTTNDKESTESTSTTSTNEVEATATAEPTTPAPRATATPAHALGEDASIALAGSRSTLKVFQQRSSKRVPLNEALRWVFTPSSDIVEERTNQDKPGITHRIVGRFTEGRYCQQLILNGQPEPFDYTLTRFSDGHIEFRASGVASDGNVTQIEGELERVSLDSLGARVLR